MGKARRNRALRRKGVNLDNLAPGIAPGITQGASAREALREHPAPKVPDGATATAHLAEVTTINRVPAWRAVLKDSTDSVWVDEPTGRIQRDAVVIVPPEVREALATGWMCLRCYEPQDEAFPPYERANHIPGCGYDIQARQAIDVRMEFRGEEHVGPALPITAYMEEQEERAKTWDAMKRHEHGLG